MKGGEYKNINNYLFVLSGSLWKVLLALAYTLGTLVIYCNILSDSMFVYFIAKVQLLESCFIHLNVRTAKL